MKQQIAQLLALLLVGMVQSIFVMSILGEDLKSHACKLTALPVITEEEPNTESYLCGAGSGLVPILKQILCIQQSKN